MAEDVEEETGVRSLTIDNSLPEEGDRGLEGKPDRQDLSRR